MIPSSPFLTRDQRRAQHALGKVREVPDRLRSDYQTLVKGFSATIVMNGLGQACAMLLAKAENKDANSSAHRRLYDHLRDWLCSQARVYPENQELIDSVIGHGQTQYVRAQAESLAYLEWLKKFAQADLTGKGEWNGSSSLS